MVPSAMMKPIFRNGSPGSSQPRLTRRGVCHLPIRATTKAGTAIRAPTINPAPNVEGERLNRVSAAMLDGDIPSPASAGNLSANNPPA